MDPEIENKFEEQSKKLDKIYSSMEKMRKYLLWTFVFSIVIFILPLIIFAVVLPRVLDALSGGLL